MKNKTQEYPLKTIRAGILGVSGYTGREVFALLLKHPGVRVTYVAANNTTGGHGGDLSGVFKPYDPGLPKV